jgi:Glycosyl transferase family 2
MKQKQIIHLYCLCWNEQRMLPFFFRHYDELVDQYYFFDNGSTDGTLGILAAHDRVQVESFTTEGDSFVETERRLSDMMWQRSRGAADWVIVVDIDEHLCHPFFRNYLERCSSEGVTFVTATGYEMLSTAFPQIDAKLSDFITLGVPSYVYSKPCVFNPSLIAKTNFAPGRHYADPEGRVVWPKTQELTLLHYKRLGLEYTKARSIELRAGLRSGDIERFWGSHYLHSAETIEQEFTHMMAIAARVPQPYSEDTEGGPNSPFVLELSKINRDLFFNGMEKFRLTRLLIEREARIEQLVRRERELNDTVRSLDVELARLKKWASSVAADAQALNETLQVVLGSWSWQFTALFRRIRSAFSSRSLERQSATITLSRRTFLSQAEREAVNAIALSSLFDPDFYLNRNPDVAATGVDPIVHYVRWGAAEDRDPSADFHTASYKARFPELATCMINPLFHALQHRPAPRQEERTAMR